MIDIINSDSSINIPYNEWIRVINGISSDIDDDGKLFTEYQYVEVMWHNDKEAIFTTKPPQYIKDIDLIQLVNNEDIFYIAGKPADDPKQYQLLMISDEGKLTGNIHETKWRCLLD